MPKQSSKPRRKRKKPVFRRACFDEVEAPDGFESCYVYIGEQFAGLGAVYHVHFVKGFVLDPYCVLNRFGMVMSSLAGKPKKLVVGHKTYDCPPDFGLKNQTRRTYARQVSFCMCEMDGQQEMRAVVRLVENPAFNPAKPTGLEGITSML